MKSTVVDSTTNPFEVEASSDLPSPIPFAGKLTLADARAALWDSGPRDIGSEVGLLAALGFSFYFFWMMEQSWAAGRPMSSLIWMGSAFLLLPYWVRFNRYLLPGHWKRTARIKASAAQAKFMRGWIDNEGLLVADGHEFARLRWEYFAPSYVFSTHIVLAAQYDPNIRIVLPTRFFPMIHAAEQAIEYLRERVGYNVDESKKTQSIRTAEFQTQPDRGEPDENIWPMLSAIDYEAARSWDIRNWPFAPNETEERVYRLVPTAESVPSLKTYFYSVGLSVVLATWFALPGFLAALGWFVRSYRVDGNLNFIAQRLPSTLLATLPLLLVLGFFAWSTIVHLRRVGGILGDDRWLCIRPRGLFYAESIVSLWWNYKTIDDIEVKDKAIVLTLGEGHVNLPIPKDFFDSEAAFEEASEQLNKYYELHQPRESQKI